MPPGPDALRQALRRFGFDAFRPGQQEVIEALLKERDVLAVLPTGSGKSLTYELTAQLLPGITVVVSPLIALMQDQIDSLQRRGIPVSLVNSALRVTELRSELERVESGAAKIVYVTPERFEDDEFVNWLSDRVVSLFAVDEAHSISEWGHDFRPAYLNLGGAIERLGRPTTLALTATATPWVRDEISERLRLRDALAVVRGVDRPNLFLEVLRVEEECEDREVLQRLLAGETQDYDEGLNERLDALMEGSGIIYARTTRAAEETVRWLRGWGISADYYHGKRAATERAEVQERFMAGEIRVICATNAFGLGVDKPDVRFVIHRDVPASLEAYYQEAGRAGRDGDLARCTLIYRPADLSKAAFLAASAHITPEKVRAVRRALTQQGPATLEELAEATKLSELALADVLASMQREGVVREARGRLEMSRPRFNAVAFAQGAEARRAAYEQSRVEMMRRYAEQLDCRRVYILNYFGEVPGFDHCDCCDNDCRAGDESWVRVQPEERVEVPFAVGARVVHGQWGEGVVQRIERDALTVLFQEAGYKTLASELVVESNLLRAAE